MNPKLIALFVVIAVAYTSAEVVIEKEIEKVPAKLFPPGVDPWLCPNYPDCNNALLHSRKFFYPNYLNPGYSPLGRSLYNPAINSVYNPAVSSVYNPTIRSVYNPAVNSVYDPAIRSIYNPAIPSFYNSAIRSTYDPTFNHPGRVLLNQW